MTAEDNPTGGIARIERQLERMDELVRNTATRQDLSDLRKEVVQSAVLDPQLSMLRAQIAKIEQDRQTDKATFEKRLEDMGKEQVSRADKLWTRLSPIIAGFAFLLTLYEFLSHVRFTP